MGRVTLVVLAPEQLTRTTEVRIHKSAVVAAHDLSMLDFGATVKCLSAISHIFSTLPFARFTRCDVVHSAD
jgi:hypothetical protein